MHMVAHHRTKLQTTFATARVKAVRDIHMLIETETEDYLGEFWASIAIDGQTLDKVAQDRLIQSEGFDDLWFMILWFREQSEWYHEADGTWLYQGRLIEFEDVRPTEPLDVPPLHQLLFHSDAESCALAMAMIQGISSCPTPELAILADDKFWGQKSVDLEVALLTQPKIRQDQVLRWKHCRLTISRYLPFFAAFEDCTPLECSKDVYGSAACAAFFRFVLANPMTE